MIAWAAAALAREPACEPFDEVALRGALLQLRVAVELDDAATHEAFVRAVAASLPCAEFVPSRRLWAEYLIHEAIRAFSAGGDWQTPLASAVRTWPDVDRLVGPGHPIATWRLEETDPLPHGTPAPPGLLLYVDGEGAFALPPAEGIHLVQKSDGRWIDGRIARDAPVPDAWLLEPVPVPPHVAVWVDVAAQVGAARSAQRASPASDWLAPAPRADLAAGIGGAARLALRSPFGLAGAVSAPANTATSATFGRAGLAVSGGVGWVAAGAGALRSPVVEGDARESVGLAFGSVAAGAEAGGAVRAAIEAGLSPAVRLVAGRAALATGDGPFKPQIGLTGAFSRVLLRQDGTAVVVRADTWTLALEAGLTWSTER